MSEWKTYKLGEIANFKYGKTIRKSDIKENGLYPVFSGYQIVGYLDDYIYENEQLIIVCRGVGGTGDIKISPPKCSITNLSIIISVNEGVLLKDYLFWVLKSSDTYALRTGSAQPQITINSLENYQIQINTNLEKQERIASCLNSLNAKIQLNTQTNQTLEAIAQTIFKSWFVDFDPVQAKANALADGASDEQATLSAMSVISGKSADELIAMNRQNPDHYQKLWDIANAFPSGFDGEVPLGWGVKKIGDLARFIKGKKPISVFNVQENDTLPHILVSALAGKYTEYATTERAVVIGIKDTLVLMDGSASGKVSVGHYGVLGSTLAKLALNDEGYWAILYSFLKEKEKDIQENTTGTSIPHTDKNLVLNYDFIIPCNFLLNSFNIIFENHQNSIINRREETFSLEKLRDELLPKLLSGEIEL